MGACPVLAIDVLRSIFLGCGAYSDGDGTGDLRQRIVFAFYGRSFSGTPATSQKKINYLGVIPLIFLGMGLFR